MNEGKDPYLFYVFKLHLFLDIVSLILLIWTFTHSRYIYIGHNLPPCPYKTNTETPPTPQDPLLSPRQ